MVGIRNGIALALTIVNVNVSAGAHAAGWTIVPATSRMEFVATVEKSTLSGEFRTFDASIRFDPDLPAEARIGVTVGVSSADMIGDDVNKAIRGPDWFDAGRFPVAQFQSTDVRLVGAGRYVAVGTLRIKDVAKSIEVPFGWARDGDAATVSGEFAIDRTAFRIGLGEWLSTKVVAADVKVKFLVRLARSP